MQKQPLEVFYKKAVFKNFTIFIGKKTALMSLFNSEYYGIFNSSCFEYSLMFWRTFANSYGCSFVAKLRWKKIFSWKNICAFCKIYTICRKKCFYMEKEFYIEKCFYWKKFFFTEKNIHENVKNIYLIWETYFYTENFCVTNKM